MILVVGATGALGGEICRQLTAEGMPVRALVRATSDPGRTGALRELGAEVVEGDLGDLESLERACEGIRAVVSTATAIHSAQRGDSLAATDLDGQIRLSDAARAAGVGRVEYVSYAGTIEVDSPLHRAKRGVERHLRESGVPYTILRPSFFMEVWLSPAVGFDWPAGRVTVFGTGENPVSFISAADVARFAVLCLEDAAAENAVIELGGPEAVAPLDAVRAFEKASGRKIEVARVSEASLRERWEGAEDPMSKTFAALQLSFARGGPVDMRSTLERWPVSLASVRDYAARVVRARGSIPS